MSGILFFIFASCEPFNSTYNSSYIEMIHRRTPSKREIRLLLLKDKVISHFEWNNNTGYMFHVCIKCQVIIQNKNRYELSFPSTLDEVLPKAQFPLLNYRSIPAEFSNISTSKKKSWIVGCSKTNLLRWSVFHEVNNQSWALLAFHISIGGFNQCI